MSDGEMLIVSGLIVFACLWLLNYKPPERRKEDRRSVTTQSWLILNEGDDYPWTSTQCRRKKLRRQPW